MRFTFAEASLLALASFAMFPSLAAARAVAGLSFSYVGRTQLAKQYGSLALYHVRRRCVVK